MGIFSQDKTTTNQTSFNQQQGISTRDISGAQLSSGGGSVTSFGVGGLSVGGGGSSAIYTQSGGASIGGGSHGNSITVNNALDPTALNTFAGLINNALTATTNNSQAALTGFQNALAASSEQPLGQVASSGGGVSPLSSVGGTPVGGGIFNTHDLIIFGAVALVGAALFFGYRKFHA